MTNFVPVKHLYSLSVLTFLSIKMAANGTD